MHILIAKLTWQFPKPGSIYQFRAALWKSSSEILFRHEKPSVTTWMVEALDSLPRSLCQPLSCARERRLKKIQFLRAAPSSLHLHRALGFTALQEGAGDMTGTDWGQRIRAPPAYFYARDAGPRVRGLLEFADVDSLLKLAEMLGGSTFQGRK